MKSTKFIMAALASFALLSGFFIADASQRQGGAEKRIQVSAVVSRLPVAFKIATATRVDERTVLSYALTNRSKDDVMSVQVVTFVTNAAGAIIGGEGWVLDVELPEGSTETYSAILKNRVEPGGRVIVAVLKTSGPGGTVTLSNEELRDLMRSQAGVSAAVSNRNVPLAPAKPSEG